MGDIDKIAKQLNANNTAFLNGNNARMAHGTYPATMFTSALQKAGLNLNGKEYFVLYWPEDKEKYYLMDDIQKRDLDPQNGGARIDVDYPAVATFGVYEIQKSSSPKLVAWFDFDHWPGHKSGSTFSLNEGLADGHYHLAADQAKQLACQANHRDLWRVIVMAVQP